MTDLHMLIDIDCIYDTRISTVSKISEKLSEELVADFKYHDRTHDSLWLLNPMINRQRYLDLYKSRDVNTLRKSITTPIISALYKQIVSSSQLPESHPEFFNFKIYLNTHPYQLLDEELQAIKEHLSAALNNVPVELVSYSLEEIKPSLLKGKYTQYFTYSLNDWTGIHLSDLKETPIPEIKIIAPLLLLEGNEMIKDPDNVEKILKMQYMGHLDIDLIPLSQVSYSTGLFDS